MEFVEKGFAQGYMVRNYVKALDEKGFHRRELFEIATVFGN